MGQFSISANKLHGLRQQASLIRATPFVNGDHKAIVAAAETLRLAVDTWKIFPGTEPYRVRAIRQAQLLGDQADRVLAMVKGSQSLNSLSLDTRLIEWLDQRADFNGDLETSEIRIPHKANPLGYLHVRDALREAFEQDKAMDRGSVFTVTGAAA